ncbi:hypothetical protein, partial [Flavobacterium sp. 38-13]|uniref:hypothetical protein n=2 Tax=Flavobacterium TaxID=237 RepID=UPI00257ACE69
GKWKVESGKWKVESGKWKVESGKWKKIVEDKQFYVCCCLVRIFIAFKTLVFLQAKVVLFLVFIFCQCFFIDKLCQKAVFWLFKRLSSELNSLTADVF